ncbi:hypothetical protein Tco_0393420 [Tanacetum coccineum]
MLRCITPIFNCTTVQRRASGNVGKHRIEGSAQTKESEGFTVHIKDKMLLMEAKEKGVTLDAEAEAFLANVECTTPYDQPLAMATTNIFEVNHEDAYYSDVDEGPNVVAAFMANMPSTNGNNHHNQSDSESLRQSLMTKTPYHQLELERRAKVVPTEVSTGSSANISMVTILDEMRDTLDEKTQENQDLSLENQNLTAELAKCKLEIVRLDTQQVKLDLERQVRQEQNLVTQRNERNAELEQEKVMLKTHLKSKDISIEFLKSENQKVLTDKKKLEDKYLDEIVCLKSANKVATDLLQKFQMPTHTIPMLSKKPKNASQDLHKDILGRSNPRYGKKAPVINASNVWDTDETLASAEVYWLPANEIASQASTPATPVTPYVPKSRLPSSTEDGLKVENVSLKRWYDELSKASTHSRTAYTEKLSALTAEHTKLQAQVTGKTSSGSTASEKPKVLASVSIPQFTFCVHLKKKPTVVKPTPLPGKSKLLSRTPQDFIIDPHRNHQCNKTRSLMFLGESSTRTKPATESPQTYAKEATLRTIVSAQVTE